MINKLGLLDFDEVIIHEVPLKDRVDNGELTEEGVRLSESKIPLNRELKIFYKNKISQSIGSSRTFKIKFISNYSNSSSFETVEDSITTIFNNEESIIAQTSEIAKRLYQIQTRQNPAGILIFIPAKIEEESVYVLLKVEREGGLEITEEKNSTGTVNFGIQLLNSIMLTEKGKLFKATLFFKDSNDEIKGYLTDAQSSPRSKLNVAKFYLNDFLGAELEEEPSVLTKKFYDSTMDFINKFVKDDEEKIDLFNSVLVILKSNQMIIDPIVFAQEHINEISRQSFIDYLKRNNADGVFPKNNSLIEKFLKRRVIKTVSGFLISGPEEVMENKLTIEYQESGLTHFSFEDTIEEVKN